MSFGGIQEDIERVLKAEVARVVLPMVREEAAKGAEASVKPLVTGVLVVSGVALIFSLIALRRASQGR